MSIETINENLMSIETINENETAVYRIAFYQWTAEGSIGESIAYELERLGHEVVRMLPEEPVPDDVSIVFTYAPYGRWMHIPRSLKRMPSNKRPFLIHWNTEGLPPPKVPLFLQKKLAVLRSQLDEHIQKRSKETSNKFIQGLDGFLQYRMLRYRYLGDYLRVQQLGIPFLLVDISAIYQQRLNKLGVPAINMPFGTSDLWYEDLNKPRDIDVLWIGSHGSWRRTKYLGIMQKALAERGIKFLLVDGRSAPFVHGDDRTALINRSRIVLNIMRTPYDDNTLRMFIAMPNRAMVISEPIMGHNKDLIQGLHYIESPLEDLPDTIEFYLNHPEEMKAIVDRAYKATTQELNMKQMVGKIIRCASERMRPIEAVPFG